MSEPLTDEERAGQLEALDREVATAHERIRGADTASILAVYGQRLDQAFALRATLRRWNDTVEKLKEELRSRSPGGEWKKGESDGQG